MQASHYTPRTRFAHQPYSFLDNVFNTNNEKNYTPAYSLVADDENHFSLTLCIPGFEKDELDIQIEQSVLFVRGKNNEENKEGNIIHQGFIKQNFEKQFKLEKTITIARAELDKGLLRIDLLKETPEELKPVSIAIHTASENQS